MIKRTLLNIELIEGQSIENKEILTVCIDAFPEKIKSISVEDDFTEEMDEKTTKGAK